MGIARRHAAETKDLGYFVATIVVESTLPTEAQLIEHVFAALRQLRPEIHGPDYVFTLRYAYSLAKLPNEWEDVAPDWMREDFKLWGVYPVKS
ncbi:hypothetical protein [Luteolibacter soli]|uniref:Uncharacterized protein n=1 Tax=Luteolibacter soli TaxID=3135280 RepID=A0ABU9AZU1_9BACT